MPPSSKLRAPLMRSCGYDSKHQSRFAALAAHSDRARMETRLSLFSLTAFRCQAVRSASCFESCSAGVIPVRSTTKAASASMESSPGSKLRKSYWISSISTILSFTPSLSDMASRSSLQPPGNLPCASFSMALIRASSQYLTQFPEREIS